MIYTTGTIAVSGNTLTGTGTNFTAAGSLIRVGCTVLAMTSPPQAFQITGITSGTVMTVSPAASPVLAAGTKYSILLSDSLSVDGLAQDIAETFGMYQRNISGFADVMNGTGDVTITVGGQAVTVPGQKSLAKKGANSDITSLTGLKTALSIAQGGTGATTAAQLRTNAGLKEGAVRDVGTAKTNVIEVGAFGLGTSPNNADSLGPTSPLDANDIVRTGFYKGMGGSSVNYAASFGTLLHMTRDGGVDGTGFVSQMQTDQLGMYFRYRITNSWTPWRSVYHTGNTTKSSDGTLKSASPIARIACPDEGTRPDIDDDGFEWCGYGVANDKARGIEIIRDGVGVYRLIGAKSLASSGWRLLPPRDPDGSGDLGVVKAEQRDNEIIVSLFRLKMVLENGEIVVQAGEPIDVPVNSWIDVRLDMPGAVIPPEPEIPLETDEPLTQPEQ